MKKYKKVIFIIIFAFIIRELYLMYVDYYNFKQLEKAKIILEQIPQNTDKFYTIKEFNEKYNTNIEPIKNCYYISGYNGDDKYLIGLLIESLIYKIKYSNKFYSYPKYSIPVNITCVGGLDPKEGVGGCYDLNKIDYEKTISNPCKEK